MYIGNVSPIFEISMTKLDQLEKEEPHFRYYHLYECNCRRVSDLRYSLLDSFDTARDCTLKFTVTHTHTH
jgi:hypothetical protein